MYGLKYFIINKLRKLSPIQIIVLSFLMLILIGTLLLLLPISSRGTRNITAFEILFTSVSCCCITGLPLFDIWQNWSIFGQIIILCLIQVGALGLVTFTTGFTLIFRKKLGLRNVKILQEGVTGDIYDVSKLVKTIFLSTIFFESVSALLMCISFVPKYGIWGIWASIFLSISAYCNAGVDITGFIMPNSSFCTLNDDYFLLIIVTLLSFIGGLGFIVIIDIYNYLKSKEHNISLGLQTKIVLKSSIILMLLGAIIFYLLESDNTMSDFSIVKKFFISFFQSSSQRTSGFTAVDMNGQRTLTKLITALFMFIGASPASTGGGIKTVTVIIIVYIVINTLKGRDDNIIYGKKISSTDAYKAITIVIMFIFCILLSTTIIYAIEYQNNIGIFDILYEVISCISTTGYTFGTSAILSIGSKLILMSLMFFGRVGPLYIMISIIENSKEQKNIVLPKGKVVLS